MAYDTLKEYITESKKGIKKDDVLYCDVCGRVVKVVKSGSGPLICCDKPMKHR